jgi:SRSO17 transposase
LKKGEKSVGVGRRYTGTAGKRENCQINVFVAYASEKGSALVDRELYLPHEWADDPDRRAEAGVPEEVRFATKGQLAKVMLRRAFEAEVRAKWVLADSIYGASNIKNLLPQYAENWDRRANLAMEGSHISVPPPVGTLQNQRPSRRGRLGSLQPALFGLRP